jgi:pyruvate/2-oxoglutarate/acetoin dehydrogenase E1 component
VSMASAPASQPSGTAVRTLTYAQAVNEGLREAMRRDPRIVLLGEDIGHHGGVYTVTRGLLDEFGADRVRDTPISEAGFIGAAMGLAQCGYRPIVELMFVDFAFVAGDLLFNQIPKLRYMSGNRTSVPLIVRTQQGSGGGKGPQHSQCLEAFFCHTPGWRVVAPATPGDAKGLLLQAVQESDPVVFLEHKALYFTKGEVPAGAYAVPFGEARILRSGDHVTVLTYSRTVAMAMDAAKLVERDGLRAEVIDLRTLNPLDLGTVLSSVRKTGRVVIVHEAVRTGGFGAELAALVAEQAFFDLDAPIRRVTGLDVPLPYSRPVENAALPSPGAIAVALRAAVE